MEKFIYIKALIQNMAKVIYRILHFLDENSRTTLSKIAKRLKTSEQRVSYTLKSMNKKRQIKGYTAVFDYAKFDFNGYLVLFRTSHKKNGSSELLKNLKELPEVVWIETLQGKFDISAMFLSPNPSSFNKSLKKFISKHKGCITDNHICTVIVIRKFGRQYLNPWAQKGEDKVIGGDRAPINFSDSEKMVCRALLEKPAAKLKELSKISRTSFKTFSSKLKLLKKRLVIRKFEPILDCARLKIFNKKVFLKYSAYDVNIEDELTNFCKENPSVVSVVKTFGSWDIVINFESLKNGSFDDFMYELRERFEELITDFEVVDVKNKEKFNYLPFNYFS